MEAEEMNRKIQNAVHSVGIEEGFRRGFKRLDVEFVVKTFECHREVARDNDHALRDMLTAGWRLMDKIICPPFVMVILGREKESKENVREQ